MQNLKRIIKLNGIKWDETRLDLFNRITIDIS